MCGQVNSHGGHVTVKLASDKPWRVELRGQRCLLDSSHRFQPAAADQNAVDDDVQVGTELADADAGGSSTGNTTEELVGVLNPGLSYDDWAVRCRPLPYTPLLLVHAAPRS